VDCVHGFCVCKKGACAKDGVCYMVDKELAEGLDAGNMTSAMQLEEVQQERSGTFMVLALVASVYALAGVVLFAMKRNTASELNETLIQAEA